MLSSFLKMPHLTLEQKIGQLFFIGIPGPGVDDATRLLLETIEPGGVCLFARNIREPQQTRDLLDAIRELSALEPILSLDQEGGLVDRLRRVLSPMPAANKLKTSEQAAELARIIAEATRILGFNMDFAPVVDVVDEQRGMFSNGLHSRAFGSSKEEVVASAGAFAEELHLGGVLSCLKHFPGLGASEVDSHEDLPQVAVSREELENIDLYPYKAIFAAADIPAVMVAHAAYPEIDLQEKDQNGKLLPSSLSYNVVTDLLRHRLGFAGLAITDDLEMGAILRNYGIGEACKLAVNAGQDMLAICASPDAIYEGHAAVLQAVRDGEITEERIDESVERIEKVRSRLQKPLQFEVSRLKTLTDEIHELNTQLN